MEGLRLKIVIKHNINDGIGKATHIQIGMLKIIFFEKIWQQVSKALKIFDPAIPLLIN